MPIFPNIEIPLGESLEERLLQLDPEHKSFRILRLSIDARSKRRGLIKQVYNVETFTSEVPPPRVIPQLDKVNEAAAKSSPVTIIGAGPAGLFAALRLIERGIPCRILERGKPILERMRDISRHWKKGEINPDSNVCFGEGGAGTFSDGKLITRVKSPHIDYVMQAFVRFGAPEEILYLANPHVGSNRIRKVIHALSSFLMEKGCPIHYNCRAEQFDFKDGELKAITSKDGERFESERFILATGHSAHDVFETLVAAGIKAEPKPFAMGFRIEHPQAYISKTQYGTQWEHPDLPTANYKLTCHNHKSNLGVYSFCMCPGGYVLAAATQPGHMVVNGMSNYSHGSRYANSGIVITINDPEFLGTKPLDALHFQSEMEKKTFQMAQNAGATTQIPVQSPLDFIDGKKGLGGRTSSPSGVIPVNLRDVYPEKLNLAYAEALENFERKMPGFLKQDSLLYGIESRTSSPVRIPRDNETMLSPSVNNMYPIGEGPGYAGGITSAAADGVRCADRIFEELL